MTRSPRTPQRGGRARRASIARPCRRRSRSAQLADLIPRATSLIEAWEARFGAYDAHAASEPDAQRLAAAWDAFGERMADHYPFFHPRYAGQMLKPPHPVAVAGYLAAMLVNPNNHALDGGPGASGLEVEVVDQLRVMFGLPSPGLGHLTSSGTIANLEALWVAREVHPGKRIVHSSAAHYTHARMCELLGITGTAVAPDASAASTSTPWRPSARRATSGPSCSPPARPAWAPSIASTRRSPCASATACACTSTAPTAASSRCWRAATTRSSRPRRTRRSRSATRSSSTPTSTASSPTAAARSSSPTRRSQRVYRHDSPFTYFTEADLHLGEISLECSRAGAAAAGLWLTLQALPLERDEGLGAVLAAGRRAALDWARRLTPSDVLALHVEPELDIVTYLPRAGSLSALDAASGAVLNAGMEDPEDPVFLSTLYLGRDALIARHPELEPDADGARVLRSVLMKPEHEDAVGWLHERVEGLARAALA